MNLLDLLLVTYLGVFSSAMTFFRSSAPPAH